MFGSAPEVRLEAIEAGLVFRQASAWMSCRQLARSPAHPRATELVALLGSAAEFGTLADARTTTDAALLWALGLAGRPELLAKRVAELEPDAEQRDAARSAFELATGVVFESADQARAWLAEQSAARLIGGEPRTLASVQRASSTHPSLALRRAIARELRIRTAGRVILAPDVFAQTWRERLAGVAELDLGLEFPWVEPS